MICRRAQVLPVEVIVRGYLAGTGWKDYQRSRAIGGQRLPVGLRRERPTARADHDPVDQGRVGQP